MLCKLIIVFLTFMFTEGVPLIAQTRRLPQYSVIETLQHRVDSSDAPKIVRSLHRHVLSYSTPAEGNLPYQLREFSLSAEHNLVTAAIMNETVNPLMLQRFKRLNNANEAIINAVRQFNPISPSYWTLVVPFQFTLKSTLAYRRWQLHRSQRYALQSTNATALLQETIYTVQDTSILLEAAAYMLQQLHKLGLQQLRRVCQPILSSGFGLLLNELPHDSLEVLASQFELVIDENTSRHRYSDLALGSLVVVVLATSSLLLLPLMCQERSKFLMLSRCFLYIAGITWFHMMVFFLYFCKLQKDF